MSREVLGESREVLGESWEVLGESWEVLGTLQNAFVALLRQTPPNPHETQSWPVGELGRGGVHIYCWYMQSVQSFHVTM